MGTARYRFLPWARHGIARSIVASDRGAPLEQRAGTTAGITVSTGLEGRIDAALFGPGDVIGLDPAAIVRTLPRAAASDTECAFLAAIEFDLPDLPWLFTPAQAQDDRLRPWLVLVVLDADGSGAVAAPRAHPARPLPCVELSAAQAAAQLPDLTQSWAWAHAQQLVEEGAATGTTAAALAEQPLLGLSRLLCPRRLEPMKAYTACLVPAFDLGVLRGCGRLPEPGAVLQPAWDVAHPTSLSLPVYYHWGFATGPGGDFEAVARTLLAAPCPPGLGLAPLRISRAIAGFASTAPDIAMDGVLGAPGAAPGGPEPVDPDFAVVLAAEVEPGGGRGTIGAPLYMAAAAGVARAGAAAAPRWFAELNLDPRARIAAGLGAAVVRRNQEALVAACWEQAGELREANALLGRSWLAGEGLAAIHRRIRALDPARQVMLTAPLHDRVRLAEGTVRGAVAASSLPAATLAAGFRRLASPRRKALRTAAERLGERPGRPLLAALAARRPGDPAAFVPHGLAKVASLGGDASGPVPAGRIAALARLAESAAGTMRGIFPLRPGPATGSGGPVRAALAMLEARHRPNAAPPGAPAKPLALEQLAGTLAEALAPRRNVRARVRSMLATKHGAAVSGVAITGAGDRLTARPAIDIPLYRWLAELRGEAFLPGAEALAANTITLAETNPRFVDAFMAGANHELHSELAWRGFPFEPTHTPCRRFWDRGDDAPYDIARFAGRDPALALGAGAADDPEQLVVLMRSDLIARFPNSVIAAWRAVHRGGVPELVGDPAPGADYRDAGFAGVLAPDIAFAGLALTREAALTGAGWFVVIEEQISEPRFGFDEAPFGAAARRPRDWRDARWVDTGTAPGSHIGVDGPLAGHAAGGVTYVRDAAHFAALALQRPFRLAIHARHLLEI